MAKKKMKVSLDLAKIKSFFVQHVEKIVFGACALGLLLLLYKAATVETYPRQAKEISDKASEKDRMLQQAVWSSDRIEKENLTLPKLDEEIAASRVAVSADDYRIAPFNEPLFETRTKRTQPELLPPTKPEVSADLAAFVVTPPAGTLDAGSIASAPPPMFGGEEFRGGKGGGTVPEPPPGVGGPVGKGGGGIPGPPGGMRGGSFGPPGMRGGPPMLAQGGPMANPGFPVGQGQKRVAIPYAVVKMLVPVKKQREIYRNAFVRSVHEDPSKDDPNYVGFIVERQEVGVSDAEDKPPEIIRETRWGDVGQKGTIADTLAKRNQQFAGYSPEVADPNVVLPTLVHPLGPKADSGWEVAKVVHSELVPAADEMTFSVELAAAEPEPAADEAAPKDAEAGPDPFAQTASAGHPNAFRPGGGFRGGPPMMGKGGSLVERSLSIVAQGSPMGGRWQGGGAAMADTEYYLLRFFDFNVEPGKSYRYRIKLGLANPNNGLDPKYLEKPELAKEKYLQTDWSEQSPVVSIPRESYFLVGEATRGSEPALELIAVRMVADQGIKAAVAKGSQYRGQIGNFRNERVDLSSDEPAFPPTSLPGEPEAKKPKKERDKPIDLLTDTLLVDIRGGDPLARSKEPAEALVLTPSGRLTVRSQVADAEEFKLQQQTIEERRKRKAGKDEPQQPLFGPTGPPGKGGGK